MTLALAAQDIATSIYNLCTTADSNQDKIEQKEVLILGIMKVIAVFSTFCLLYSAYFLVERRNFQWMLGGLTFCIYPVATLDVIGTSSGLFGLSQVIKHLQLSNRTTKSMNQISKAVEEQLMKEGYQLAYFWYSQEVGQRIRELRNEFNVQHPNQIQQLESDLKTADRYLATGAKCLGIMVINAVGASLATKIPALCWLDRRMVDFSKWLALRC